MIEFAINLSLYKNVIGICFTLQFALQKAFKMKLVGLLFIFLSINLVYGFFYSPDGLDLVEKNVKIYFS